MSNAVLDAEAVLPHASPLVHQTALADVWPLPEHVCQRDHSVTALAYRAPDRDLSGTVTVRAHRAVVN